MIQHKTIGAVLFLIAVIVAMPAVFADDVGQIDDLDSVSSIDEYSIANGNSFQDLQDMLDAADEGSTVYLTSNYIYDDTFTSEGVNISKSITIEGNSFTIDGLNKSRIFNIFSKNVVLNNITFANGYSQDGGAIIFNNYAPKSQITNCNFINNTADDNGGAIYFASYNMNILLDNLKFINNRANFGGAIKFESDVVNLTINRSVFRNNSVEDSGDGGAILINSQLQESTISDSYFVSNAAEFGGGLYINGPAGGNVFARNNFINNSAVLTGGGIYVVCPDDNNFTDSCFSGNTARMGAAISFSEMVLNSVFKDLNFVNNHAKDSAGGIHMYGGIDASIFENIRFINNSGMLGGALNVFSYVFDSSFKNITSINNSAGQAGAMNFNLPIYSSDFDNLIFINNSADDNGGAVYFDELVSGSLFNNMKFINNSADCGGGIFARVNIIDSLFNNINFINNRAINGSAFYANGIFRNNFFNDTKFSSNIAEDSGTFYFGYYKTIDNVFDNSLFENNVAEQGSAIYFEEKSDETTINNTDFINNTAYQGSLIYYTDGAVYIINCEFYNNTGNNTGIIKKNPYMNVTVDDSITFGEMLNGTVDLPEDATGNITVSVDGNEVLNLNVTDATTSINLRDLDAGVHSINITYSGDYYYEPSSEIAEVTVNKKETFVSADSKSFDVADVKSVSITLKTSDGVVSDRLITMIVNGKSYNARTDESGVAKFTVQLTREGEYPASIKFDGDSTYQPSASDIMISVVNSQIIPSDDNQAAPDYKVTKSFDDMSSRIIKLVIFGKTYFAQVGDGGIARFTIVLDDGTQYEVTVEFVDNSPNGQFKLTVGDETYSAEINSDGVAKFNIDFNGDESEATVEFV